MRLSGIDSKSAVVDFTEGRLNSSTEFWVGSTLRTSTWPMQKQGELHCYRDDLGA